jgi:hypothetical protein
MNLKLFGIACTVAMLAACSTQPQQPAVNAAAPAAATAAPAAALATPAAATPAAAPAISRDLIAAGYKPKTIKGEVFYCRKEDVTNTAFKKTVCLNEEQFKEQERRTKEMQREMMRSQPNPSCLGPNCG